MQRHRRVLIFCAHSDDQVFGAGGTIAKLALEGAEIKTIICSYGELTHPHLDPVEIRRTRVLESKRADEILGGNGVQFLGLAEGKFHAEFEERGLQDKLSKSLRAYKPDVIFTHSSDDPHPDHKAVHQIVLSLHKTFSSPCEVYTFDVWTFFDTKRTQPRMVVNISKTFVRKLDALSAFKSQKVALLTLLWTVYLKSIYHGWRNGARYAEIFCKVR